MRQVARVLALGAVVVLLSVAGCDSQPVTPPTPPTPPAPSPGAQADWTVMVFLNGDNSLEPMALDDFKEMARVGSTDRVQVVAQVDLNGGYAANPPFTQTLRFHVCLLYTSPSPRDQRGSRMPSSA